mgnify:CR=1 FL=1
MQSTYITFIVGMIAILNPIGNTAIYIGMTSGMKRKTQNKCAIHCAFAVTTILLFSLWFGQPLLSLFGITVGAFGSAGGLIVLLIAINMLRGQPHRPGYHTHVEEKTSLKSPAKPMSIKHQIAVVPLAIPIIAGPGAISKVIYQSYAFPSLQDKAMDSLFLIILSCIIGVILYFAPLIGKALGEYGMKVVTRVMGLILAAIAMQMLCSNLIKLLPGLA